MVDQGAAFLLTLFVALERATKLLEIMLNEAWKAISPHTLESTDGLFHGSLHFDHEDPCGHSFPGFVGGLFRNDRVDMAQKML